MIRETRICRFCNQSRVFPDEFVPATVEKSRRRCKVCHTKRIAEYRLKRRLNLKERVVSECGRYCGICGNTKLLYLDHCHKTGKIRGILCRSCNIGIGMFRENSEIILKAIDYISRTDRYEEYHT